MFKDALDILEIHLSKGKYVAGDFLSLADLSILAFVTTLEAVIDYDYSKWKNVNAWMQAMKKELPYYAEINEGPLKHFKQLHREGKLVKNK